MFFFKQKTAYEMRISDWSSDVCSSDLLIMFAFAQERGAALLIDEPGRGVRKAAVRIGGCLAPFGLEEERPASAEALQHVVRPRAGRDQLGLGGGFEIGSAEAEHPQIGRAHV